jgi:hypothetical protein
VKSSLRCLIPFLPFLQLPIPKTRLGSTAVDYCCVLRVLSFYCYYSCQSQSYFTTGDLLLISSSWRQALWDSRPAFFFQLNTCGYSPYVTSSPTRGWVCRLQLLLVFASAVILRSESHGIHDYISLSQILDSPNLEGQVLLLISPTNGVARLYPQILGSISVASYDSQGSTTPVLPNTSYNHFARTTRKTPSCIVQNACLLVLLAMDGFQLLNAFVAGPLT